MGNKHKMNAHLILCKYFVNPLLLLTALFVLLFLHTMPVTAAPLAQDNLPTYGWVVAEDLEVGEVPGLPPAQRFRMRHQDSWELLAYCVDPSIEAPPEGTNCQLIDEDTFWCGDGLQHLRLYQVLQTPPPPSPTATLTPTFTPTPTQTPTSTQTPIPTVTATPRPTQEATQAQENKPTPTPRSRSGQSGIAVQKADIFRWTLGGALIGLAGVMAMLEWQHYLHNKKK